MTESNNALAICWTTTSTLEQAQQLAHAAIEARLAACVQIDAPIESVYPWEGKVERDSERRLWLKTPAPLEPQLKDLIFQRHPYDTPQWVAVTADKVDEKYLKWAQESSNLRGFR